MITLTPRETDLLKKYSEAVIKAPRMLHLTSESDALIFWDRHVMDAVQFLQAIPLELQTPGLDLLDVGSGNGIPGIPISILRPEWNVSLLDSDNKKCGFLDMFRNICVIKNAKVITGRAESLSRGPMRSAYDLVIARALGKLPVAIELAGAFVRQNGHLIVPHGTSWKDQVEKTMRASEVMGLSFKCGIDYSVAGTTFTALIYRKEIDTRPDYPRAVGVPSKRPL